MGEKIWIVTGEMAMESHHIMVAVQNSSDEGAAIAHATQWLTEEVGEVRAFQEVDVRTWKGDLNVHFILLLDDEQVESVGESDSLTHLEAVT